MRRVVVRRFRDFGVLVDANDRGPPRAARAVRDQRPRRRGRRPADPGIVDGEIRGLRLDRRLRLAAARARALVRVVRALDRHRDAAGTLRGDRRRPHEDRRLHRALHQRQHVPRAADRPAGARRAHRRMGRPRLGPAAGERGQRDRGQPLREPAGRASTSTRGRRARPCGGARSPTRRGGRSATTAARRTPSTATTTGVPPSGTTISAQPGRDRRWR